MRTKSGTDSGFSLLELSISFVIIGLITASFLSYMKISQQKAVMANTQSSLNAAVEAIEVYLEWNRKLPCPAPQLVTQDDPLYGNAADCAVLMKGGIFASEDPLVVPSKIDPDRKIAIGRLPYKDLNIPQKDTKDGWNKELYYAVSLDMTQADRYSQHGGVIEVIDRFDNPITKSDSKAQYVIWSAAANNTNTLAGNCLKNEGPEAENCNGDGVFRVMPISLGSVYFDDMLSYAVYVKKPKIVDENCDLIEHLASGIPNITEIIQENELETDLFYIRPGEIVSVCNKAILRELGEKNCVSFVCRADNTLGNVEVIR